MGFKKHFEESDLNIIIKGVKPLPLKDTLKGND